MPTARFHRLSDWLAWQETLHPWKIELGLARVRQVAQRMGLLPLPCPVVVVAGTNGKGSSVALLESVYRAAGHRTVCYTSPHLLRYNERVRIDGRECSDQRLCDAFAAIDAARGRISLSYFEFGTLAALYVIHQAPPDIAILEVGLGGRLDAVNIVDADVALVTRIGIDHVAWLGADRESIGREKAGIFRSGRPAVCADPSPPASLRAAAKAIGADWYAVGSAFTAALSGTSWSFRGRTREWLDLPWPALPGGHQLENAIGALAVVECLLPRLPLETDDIRNGLRAVTLAGRAQVLPGLPEVLLDVAHNPDGAARLAALLRQRQTAGATWLVLGMLEDKDARGFAAAIADCVDTWCLADLCVERGLPARELQERIGTCADAAALSGSPAQAFRFAHDHAAPADRIVVCGSFATVAEVLATRV
jgi:dihydrofolate synthase/folylpolyglutamate synthase